MVIPIPSEWRSVPPLTVKGAKSLLALCEAVKQVAEELQQAAAAGVVKPLMIYGNTDFQSLPFVRSAWESNAVKLQYGSEGNLATVFFQEDDFMEYYARLALGAERDSLPIFVKNEAAAAEPDEKSLLRS